MRDWPLGTAGPTPLGWRWPQALMRDAFGGWPANRMNALGRTLPAAMSDAVFALDARAGLTNIGTAGDVLRVQSGSTATADTNDPTFLDWRGRNYLYLPGVASNYASTPDSAALSITGDIDIKIMVAMADWTPTTNTALIAKSTTTGNQRSFALIARSDGKLQLSTSSDGTNTTVSSISTAATGVTDGNPKWVRATMDVNDGAGNNLVKFYLSDDAATWTQLGTTVTTAGTTSFFDSTAVLEIGSLTNGSTNTLSGAVYRVIIQSAYDTADNTSNVVFDADFTTGITSGGQTSFTESSSNAATVTINRSTSGKKACAVVRPVWLFGTDDYLEVADDDLLDFGQADSFTVLAVARQWGTQGTNDTFIAKKANATAATRGWSVANGSLSVGTAGNGIVADGLKLTSVAGQYSSAPDSAALSITGDLDIKVRVALADWTPSVRTALVAKYSSAVQASYYLSVETDGKLRLLTSPDGSTTPTNTSTVATGIADGATKWVRATIDVDNGSSQRVVKFYTADDPGTTWTQLGTTVTTAGNTSIFDGSASLEIGTVLIGSTHAASGTISRVIIQSAYDTADNTTSLAFDADFDAQEPGTMTFTESSTNAAVVTINGCYPFLNQPTAQVGDGTNSITRFTTATTNGQTNAPAFVVNRAARTITPYLNGVAGTPRTVISVGSMSNSEVVRIGRLSGAGTEYADMELLAVAIWRRPLQQREIATIAKHYGAA